jgi:hypothetical protein
MRMQCLYSYELQRTSALVLLMESGSCIMHGFKARRAEKKDLCEHVLADRFLY